MIDEMEFKFQNSSKYDLMKTEIFKTIENCERVFRCEEEKKEKELLSLEIQSDSIADIQKALMICGEKCFRKDIYLSPVGRYVITDTDKIFTIRKEISPLMVEHLEELKRVCASYGMTEQTETRWRKTKMKKGFLINKGACFILKNESKEFDIKEYAEKFLKRDDKASLAYCVDFSSFYKFFLTEHRICRYYKVYISHKDKAIVEQRGYNVKSEKSFRSAYNIVSGEYEKRRVSYFNISREGLISAARACELPPAGHYFNANGGLIKARTRCGVKSREIRLTSSDGKTLDFSSVEDAASYFNVSSRTIQRAIKGKSQGDAVTLRKKVEFVLS